MIWKGVTRTVLIITIISVCIVFLEVGYFYWVLQKKETPKRADAIVVFAGSDDRVKAGFDLVKSGLADFLVISPASEKQLKKYEHKNGNLFETRYIIENKAGTTFENAIYTRKIIEKHNLKSIILLTSSYHFPRSYLLLKTTLFGKNTRIQLYGVGKSNFKQIYSEMIKLWASLGEFGYYGLTGRLPEKNIKSYRAVQLLRAILL